MLYRAYSKDAEQSGNAARAVAHFQAMMDSLNGINTSEQKEVPEDR
jgi:cytochrome c-type biogenesis protein CcmH/NrfG